jgi:hypothetical protein
MLRPRELEQLVGVAGVRHSLRGPARGGAVDWGCEDGLERETGIWEGGPRAGGAARQPRGRRLLLL